MKCNNDRHDHTESKNGKTVRMVCLIATSEHITTRPSWTTFTTGTSTPAGCTRAVLEVGGTPCTFNINEVLVGVLPDLRPEGPIEFVDWSCATAQETSDLLNNLRDGFSEFWGVRV